MDRSPCLPSLAERSSPVPLEAIEPWPIWDMKRVGALEPGFTDEFEGRDPLGQSVCKIATSSEAMSFSIGGTVQVIRITHTTCGKGGRRPWWMCPGCDARRGVIYLRKRSFGCRSCLRLPYRSQRMSRYDRSVSKAKQMHVLLGGSGSIVDELPLMRPHGMRRRSYLKKRAQFSELLTLINQLLCERMNRLYGSDRPPFATKRWPWKTSAGPN